MILDHFDAWKSKYVESTVRRRFNSAARIEFYESMSLLMENGVKLIDALRELYDIYGGKQGKNKKGEEFKRAHKDARAVVIYDCIVGTQEGIPLSKILMRWVDYQEATIISAGEKSGDIVHSFANAVRIIESRKRIILAIVNATAYPTILLGLVCVILNIVSNKLVPNLAKSSDPTLWEGAPLLLYQLSHFVTVYGRTALGLLLSIVIGVALSFPRMRGSLRVYLDRIPPWSIYRSLHSATFMLNVSVMQEGGIKLHDALVSLAENSNPWLRERLNAAIYGIKVGSNLGVALYNAGYEFPDRRAIQFLLVLANRDGFEEALRKFSDRWLEVTIKNIETSAKRIVGVQVMLIGVMLLVVVAGMFGIQDVIDAGARR